MPVSVGPPINIWTNFYHNTVCTFVILDIDQFSAKVCAWFYKGNCVSFLMISFVRLIWLVFGKFEHISKFWICNVHLFFFFFVLLKWKQSLQILIFKSLIGWCNTNPSTVRWTLLNISPLAMELYMDTNQQGNTFWLIFTIYIKIISYLTLYWTFIAGELFWIDTTNLLHGQTSW